MSGAVDPRAKLVFSLSVIVVAVLLDSIYLLSGILIFLVLLSLMCGTGIRAMGKRLALVIPFAGVMAAWQPFIRGETVIFSIYGITGTLEGGVFGLVLLLRVLVAVSALTVFTSTVSESEMGHALRYIRIPPVLVATILMTLRYMSLLDSRRKRVKEAQFSRLFSLRKNPAGPRWVLKNLAYGVALLFISSYEQGERVYDSMLSRGYNPGGSTSHAAGQYSTAGTAAFFGMALLIPAMAAILILTGIPIP